MRSFFEKYWPVAAVLATVFSAGTGAAAWYYTDYEAHKAEEREARKELQSLVMSNREWVMLSRFKTLEALREKRTLTIAEYREFCLLGRKLEFFSTCPPRLTGR